MNIFAEVALKPQDVLLLLKLLTKEKVPSGRGGEWTWTELTKSIGISVGEAHNGLQRAKGAGLVTETGGEKRIVKRRLLEFLVHGVPVSFYAERGEVARGVPTAAFGPPLADKLLIDAADIPLVWQDSKGTRRGETLVPIYPTVVMAALADRELYELLVLVDALRVGRARERNMAKDILTKRLASSKDDAREEATV